MDIITLDIFSNSEKRYGVRLQSPPTCPLIDNAIAEITNSTLADTIKLNLINNLEQIRQNARDIRGWGEYWKQKVKTNEPSFKLF